MRIPAIALITLIVACSPASPPGDAAEPVQRRDDPELMEKRQQMLERKALSRTPESAPAVIGEVPEALLARVLADLTERVQTGEPVLLRAESVTWPSGALGCAEPGMNYTQATVPGYHVVYQVAGKTWDYRLKESGWFKLCDNSPALKRPAQNPTQ